jgi:hypothetical protein
MATRSGRTPDTRPVRLALLQLRPVVVAPDPSEAGRLVIAEAIAAVYTLGWALLVWVLLLGVVGSLAVYAVVVGVWCACRAVTRGGAAVSAAMGARKPLTAPLAPELPLSVNPYTEAPERRTAAHEPSWAQPDTKEAA